MTEIISLPWIDLLELCAKTFLTCLIATLAFGVLEEA